MRLILLAREIAAEQRLDAEGGKESGFHSRAAQTGGILLGEVTIDDAGSEGRYGLKRCETPAQRDVGRSQHELIAFDRRADSPRNQTVGVWIWERAK